MKTQRTADVGNATDGVGACGGSAVAETAPRFKAIFPLGRGSRGKTTFLRWAVERARLAGRNVLLADLDRTNQSLKACFPEAVSPKYASESDVRATLAQFSETMFDAAAADMQDYHAAAVDFGGGDQVLKAVAKEMGLAEFLTDNGVTPVAVHVMGPDLHDLAYLRDMEQDTGFQPDRTIIVLNEATLGGRPLSDFEALTKHSTTKAVVDRGAVVVSMPLLPCMPAVDDMEIGFQRAANGERGDYKDAKPLIRFEQHRLRVWLRDMEANFAKVAEWLP